MGTLAGGKFWIASIGSVLVAVALLLVLHGAPNRVKRQLLVVCTFLAGLFYFLEFFLPPDPKTTRPRTGGTPVCDWTNASASAISFGKVDAASICATSESG